MRININIALFALVALVALMPSNSSAHHDPDNISYVVCIVNNEEISEDEYVIEGTGGADIIDCGHSFRTGPPEEQLSCPFNNDGHFISGGGGKDFIIGSDCNDRIDGGASDDDIYGLGGSDIIFGGVGSSPASGVNCELETAAAGRIFLAKGGSGDDLIDGGEGRDCINAGSGEDEVYGGPGNDKIYGGNHADLIDGGPGDDTIDGGWHTDTCVYDVEDTPENVICENIVDEFPPPDGDGSGGGGGGGPNCDRKPLHRNCV